MRPALLAVFLALPVACSSADFELAAPATDSGSSPVEDTFVAADTGGGQIPDATEPSDACSEDPPAPPCVTAQSDYGSQISTAKGPKVATLDRGRALAIHMRMPRNGRVEKLIVRMRAIGIAAGGGGGLAGSVTVSAYRRGCSSSEFLAASTLPVQTGDDWAFSFANTSMLPVYPVGTDVDFVITTDSTLYTFDVFGAGIPNPNPHGLYWASKTGTAAWEISTGTMISCEFFTWRC